MNSPKMTAAALKDAFYAWSIPESHPICQMLFIAVEALEAVANDEEAGKWGPDITTAGHAREALARIKSLPQ